MSEVNADGVLLNPHEALLQEVQALTNSLTAEEPEGMEDDKAHTVYAGNGEPAGAVGGVPHTPVSAALAAPAHKGAVTGQEGRPGGQNEETKAVSPTEGGGGTGTTQTDD